MMGLHDLQYTFDALVARWVENPYDGHTPAATLAATEKLTGVAVTDAYVDKGYRGHGYTGGADVINAVLAAAGSDLRKRLGLLRREAGRFVCARLESPPKTALALVGWAKALTSNCQFHRQNDFAPMFFPAWRSCATSPPRRRLFQG